MENNSNRDIPFISDCECDFDCSCPKISFNEMLAILNEWLPLNEVCALAEDET